MIRRCRYCGSKAKLDVLISKHTSFLGIPIRIPTVWDVQCESDCERSMGVELYFAVKTDECFNPIKRIKAWNKRQRADFIIGEEDEKNIQAGLNE